MGSSAPKPPASEPASARGETRMSYLPPDEALGVTEQRLSAMLRAIGDAVIATDAGGRIIFINAVAEALTGWTDVEARQRPLDQVFRVVDASTRSAAESPFAKAIRETGVLGPASPTLLVRRDGTEIAIDETAAPVRDPHAELAGIVLVFRDITEKRREEDRRAFLGAVSDQLVGASLDYEARLSVVARLAVPRLADWVAIDMVGEAGALRRVTVAHVDPSKVAWLAELERRYPVRPEARGSVPGVVRTGRSHLVREVTDEMLVAGARDAEHLEILRGIGLRSYLCVALTTRGRTIGAITFATTVETRRLYGPDDLAFAEEVARRAAVAIDNARLHTETEAAERRFRALAAAIPQIVWVMDPAGNHEYLSPRWFEYTGQSQSVPFEELWQRAIHPEDIEGCFQRWAHARATGEVWQVEYRLRRADGVYRWHLGRAVPVADGGAVKWYGTATDIDEQKRAIRARDDILATVSHDLRSPLGAIRFASTLLREGEALPEMLSSIERSADRMEALIKDLLDIAAIESGQLSVVWEPEQASALVAEALGQHLPPATQKGVTLTIAPDSVDVTLPCDRARVLQVLANLIGNALKFTPASGSITLWYGVTGAHARFAVSDSGPGIPPSRRTRVFDRFWRDQASAGAGTGLGLAICKGIIEQHGGEIWVDGDESAGATFIFTLPLARPARAP